MSRWIKWSVLSPLHLLICSCSHGVTGRVYEWCGVVWFCVQCAGKRPFWDRQCSPSLFTQQTVMQLKGCIRPVVKHSVDGPRFLSAWAESWVCGAANKKLGAAASRVIIREWKLLPLHSLVTVRPNHYLLYYITFFTLHYKILIFSVMWMQIIWNASFTFTLWEILLEHIKLIITSLL